MDEETQKFLLSIVNSIARILAWMIANLFFGMYMEWAFFEHTPELGNIIYYLLSVITFLWLLKYLRSKWKDKM